MNVQTLTSGTHLPGLSQTEVERSRKTHGANIISKRKRKGFWAQYLASFGDPIIKILLIALAVNVIFLFKNAGWYESVGIAVAVLIATLVSTLSEYGSESAFEKLQQESGEINCRVRRNNTLFLLPVADLVVGDVVLLQSGERIPADGHLISGKLSVDQSALNGETKEARKYTNSGELEGRSDLMSHAGLFQGSVICEGDAAMVVDRVGDNTFYGQLAVEIQEETAESPLKMRLQGLAKIISRMGYTAAAIVAAANLFNAFIIDSRFSGPVVLARLSDPSFVFGTLVSTLTLAITVIVMAVPEGLPMMITVVLSANMKKMLQDNVLVRKLVGIETAGSLNILFTDKTGTLTKGQLLVTGVLDGEGQSYDTAAQLKRHPALFQSVMTTCLYNTDSAISGEKTRRAIGGNGTDRALLEYALPYLRDVGNAEILAREPFHSRNKYSSSHIRQSGKTLYLIKGAPEMILSQCSRCLTQSGTKPFDSRVLQAKMREMGEKAVRMLALAQGSTPRQKSGLTLIGVVGIRDEIRKEARPAIRQISEAGIQVVMITGDNKQTAMAIARETGLLGTVPPSNAVLTSEELSRMSDSQVKKALKDIRVVARALPSDKSRLVKLAQELGQVTGMTGDGINDAPALKKADVGFSMGTGTEVAKEAGDIIILDNNIESIAKAVLYGRTIFKSIRKFIIFQLTMNLCAVGLSVICPFLGIDAPLTVMQMLWVNMIMDTLAGLAFSGEAPLGEYMREPPKKRGTGIINRYMYSEIAFTGLYTTALCILFLTLPVTRELFHFGDGTDYFMTSFFALFIFAGVFNSLNARTYRLHLFSHLYLNKMFVIVMLLVCAVQILLIYFGGTIFRTTGLIPHHLELIVLLALSVVPVDMVRKLWLRVLGRKGHV